MKNLKKVLYFFLVIFIINIFHPAAHAETNVSGNISSDTTWTLANSPYIVQSALNVNSGVTLNIEPGVIVKFNTSVDVSVNGILNANGTSDSNIYFTSLKDDTVGGDTNGDGKLTSPTSGNWGKIYIYAGAKGNFSNIVLKYAGGHGNPPSGLSNYGGILNVSTSKFSDVPFGIYQDSGTTTVMSSEFSNESTGFYLHLGTADISKSYFHDNSTAGIFNYDGTLNVFDSRFINNVNGIRQYGATLVVATMSITKSEFSNQNIGVYIDGGSVGNVSQSYFHNNTSYGIYNPYTQPIDDARNNYWGDPLGPQHSTNPSGLGDKVSDGVNFVPWLGSNPLEIHSALPTLENLSQYQEFSTDPVQQAGSFIGNSIILKADISDSDSLSANLEFEFKPIGAAFDGTNIQTATATTSSIPLSKKTLSITIKDLIPKSEQYLPNGNQKSFHWRARAIDAEGNKSDWIEFGGSNSTAFTVKYTLGFAASQLAKQLVNHTYLWGGKGWDYTKKLFVDSNTIISGYNYGNSKIGQGLDCSGLVMWSYNRSVDPTKPASKNFIKSESADQQYRYNTKPVTESELQPGDVLFFDWGKFHPDTQTWDGIKDGNIDHVVEYVGNSGDYDVVSASSEKIGIVPRHVRGESNILGFVAFKRPVPSPTLAMQVRAHSPINLNVTDPEGYTINQDTVIPSDEEYLREVPGQLYYSEIEQGTDGNPMDTVYSYNLKQGVYKISVTPMQGATPNQTYSLDFTAGDNTVELAHDVPLSSIPSGGYGIVVGPDNIPKLDITPPEAHIIFDTSAKKITITGSDDASGVTVSTTNTFSNITDGAGNTLTLNISKNTTQSNSATLVIPSFSYSNGINTNTPTSLRYFWTTNPKTSAYTLLISAIKTPTERLISIYSPVLNKTYIVESTQNDDNTDLSLQSALLLLRKKLKTYDGIIIPHISTNKGKVVVEY